MPQPIAVTIPRPTHIRSERRTLAKQQPKAAQELALLDCNTAAII